MFSRLASRLRSEARTRGLVGDPVYAVSGAGLTDRDLRTIVEALDGRPDRWPGFVDLVLGRADYLGFEGVPDDETLGTLLDALVARGATCRVFVDPARNTRSDAELAALVSYGLLPGLRVDPTEAGAFDLDRRVTDGLAWLRSVTGIGEVAVSAAGDGDNQLVAAALRRAGISRWFCDEAGLASGGRGPVPRVWLVRNLAIADLNAFVAASARERAVLVGRWRVGAFARGLADIVR